MRVYVDGDGAGDGNFVGSVLWRVMGVWVLVEEGKSCVCGCGNRVWYS